MKKLICIAITILALAGCYVDVKTEFNYADSFDLTLSSSFSFAE